MNKSYINKSIRRINGVNTVKTQTNPIEQSTNNSIQQRREMMYINNTESGHVISGYFPKENSVRAMAIKKVNQTLSVLLLCLIVISSISYYFVVSSEIKLNEYSNRTIMLNDENTELQNKLDKLKSFSNVDISMQKNNLLQKPDKVIEAPEVSLNNNKKVRFDSERPFSWSIGY